MFLFKEAIAGLIGFMLMISAFIFIITYRSFFHFVTPGYTKIIMGLNGKIIILNSGLHFKFGYSIDNIKNGGIWNDIGKCNLGLFPEVDSTFTLDPAPAQFNTNDNITGSIDVSIIVKITDWIPKINKLISDDGNVVSRIDSFVKQWISNELIEINSTDVNYSNISKLLNESNAIERLNNLVKETCYLEVQYVLIDSDDNPNGAVSLDSDYVNEKRKNALTLRKIENDKIILAGEKDILEMKHKNYILKMDKEFEQLTKKSEYDNKLKIEEIRHSQLQQEKQNEILMANTKVNCESEKLKIVSSAESEVLAEKMKSENKLKCDSDINSQELEYEYKRLTQLFELNLTEKNIVALLLQEKMSNSLEVQNGNTLIVPPESFGIQGINKLIDKI